MIHKCSCQHEQQDKLYGKGNRVHNECNPKASSKSIRCTVCGSVKTIR